MLLKTLTAHNPADNSRTFTMESDDSTAQVINITGLGPVTSSLFLQDYATLNGSFFQGSRKPSRNIVITFHLTPDLGVESVYDVRNGLYEYFMTGSEVKLEFNLFDRFENDLAMQNLVVSIDGVVESFESELFTLEPTVAVSILCPDPDFLADEVTEIEGLTSSTGGNPTNINYEGSSPIGVKIQVDIDRVEDRLQFLHFDASNTGRGFNLDWSMADGDVITYSSVPGDKYIRHQDPFTKSVLAGCPYIHWFTLTPGENKLYVRTNTGADMPFTVSYVRRYGGL